jgi:rhodanese-related sulfurtransferase
METVRQLSGDGWQAVRAYGVTTIVDLREPAEIEADEPLDASPLLEERTSDAREGLHGRGPDDGMPHGITRTVNVPLLQWSPGLGEHFDRINLAQPDAVASTRAVYLEMLRIGRARFTEAVLSIADAPNGAVLVHCHAGKDRTGLVVALLLLVTGASAETVAEDYALSGQNLEPLMKPWLDDAVDERARELRRRVAAAPAAAMIDVIGELDRAHGGAAGYFLDAGATDDDLARVRSRLLGS